MTIKDNNPKPKHRHFDDAFKRNALIKMESRGSSVTVEQVAHSLGVAASQLYDWKSKLGKQRSAACERISPRQSTRVQTDAQGRHFRPHSKPFRRHHGFQTRTPHRAQHARSRLQHRAHQHALGRRHHVHPDARGWLFLAVLLDIGSRRVVGFSMGATMHTELCSRALSIAIGLRCPGPGIVHHTDRGSQYASGDYSEELKAHNIIKSMSRKGNCWDKAVSESFFATLKKELAHRTTFESRSEAIRAIADYIDYFYNTTRLHSTLGYLSPLEFERCQLRQQQTA